MVARRLAAGLAVMLVVSACAAAPDHTPAAAPGHTPAATPSAATVRVTLTDALRIEPAQMTVPLGVPVTFVVTNTGATDHEFYVGDEAAQSQHEDEMRSMGGMTHDEPNGISLEAGETMQLVMTFAEPGVTLAGCHLTGHYPGGMRATITVG